MHLLPMLEPCTQKLRMHLLGGNPGLSRVPSFFKPWVGQNIALHTSFAVRTSINLGHLILPSRFIHKQLIKMLPDVAMNCVLRWCGFDSLWLTGHTNSSACIFYVFCGSNGVISFHLVQTEIVVSDCFVNQLLPVWVWSRADRCAVMLWVHFQPEFSAVL